MLGATPLGALEGLGLGVLGGGAGGAVLFALTCPNGESSNCSGADRGGYALIGAGVCGVLGGLVGAVIGLVRGHEAHYLFY